ncbi:MAG: flagellar hook protein FlgE [Pseudomonadota bacterium]
MSLYSALYSGVSGLSAYSNAMGVISDNITNVNTIGYKDSETRFSTLVTEAQGSRYSPGGVAANTVTNVSQQGLLQQTGRDTDLSIDGAGMFVVKDQPVSGAEGTVTFTRAGSFSPDEEGFLRNVAGNYLMGWRLESDGSVINTGSTDLLQPVTTAGLTGTASETTRIRLRANLMSSTPVNPLEATYDATNSATNIASGAIAADFTRDVQVYDREGNTHIISYSFLKSSVPNEWHLEIHADPATEVNTLPGFVDGQIATGTVAFRDGRLDLANTSASLQAPVTVDWSNGASDSVLNIELGEDQGDDGFTQFNSPSTLFSTVVDGAIFGNVIGLTVDDNGTATAIFDNGLTQDIYKIALAVFPNEDGLARLQSNNFGVSDSSGSMTLVEAGSGGSGTVEPGTLEASTVDLAEEFSDLIVTQRAYSASTRVITTTDEMLSELNSIKR